MTNTHKCPSSKLGLVSCGLILAALALVSMLFSCSPELQVRVQADQSMQISLKATVFPIFSQYLNDLGGGKLPFDQAAVQRRFAQEKGLQLKSLDLSGKDGKPLALEATVTNLGQLMASRPATVRDAFTFSTVGGRTRLSLRLDKQVIGAFLNMGLQEGAGDAAYLLPQDPKLNAKSYQAQLDWALSDYGVAEARAQMFARSVVRLDIQLPRAVVQTSGFTLVDKARGIVRLELPLLELLTLATARTYSVDY